MTYDINIECTVTATSVEMADNIYKLAMHRLLHVNNWNQLDGSLLSDCKLIDAQGIKVDREVHTNDYLQLNEPNNADNDSTKWIRVERIEASQSQDGMESIELKTRPFSNPWEGGISEYNHPLGAIGIVRKGLNITARVYAEAQTGINEAEVVGRMRNISSVVYATLGAYRVQWRSLVHAILGDLDDVGKFAAQV